MKIIAGILGTVHRSLETLVGEDGYQGTFHHARESLFAADSEKLETRVDDLKST